MNSVFFLWFLRIIPFVLVIALVLTWIPWRKWAFRLWGDNPEKCKVYVEYGEHIEVCDGRLAQEHPKGLWYRYKCFDRNMSVIVPRLYPYRFVFGARQIRVKFGDMYPAPLGGEVKPVGFAPTALDELMQSNIGKNLGQTIHGKALNIMSIIIVVVIVIVGGLFLYKNMIEPSMNKPAINQPAQQLTPEQAADLPPGVR